MRPKLDSVKYLYAPRHRPLVLFWKTSPGEKRKSIKKPKEKIPSVVVSENWQKYEKRKLEKKEKFLEEKERKKQIRAEKQQQNKILKDLNVKRRKNKVVAETNKISSSDTDSETQDIIDSTNFDIDVGDYVIVKYNEAYFPGCVMNTIEKENTEYRVKAMEPTGQNWKWPTKEDILNYKKKT